jgi:PEP-CTERM motif
MKTLGFALGLLLVSSALSYGNTLEIASGSLASFPDKFGLVPGITSYNMAGSGFSISGYNGDLNYTGGSLFDISFIGGQIFPTIVNVGPSTCDPGINLLVTCGQLDFTIGTFAPVIGGNFAGYSSTVNFTATGFVDTTPEDALFGPRTPCCDLEGHGTVTLTYEALLSPTGGVAGYGPKAQFTFVEPEPGTSILVLVGLSLVGIPFLSRRKRESSL